MKRASCGLLYGAMNTTKTTQLGRIARYLYEKYGLISRLISADNEHDTLDRLISAGIIEVFDVIALPNPFGVFTKLSQGYWPLPRPGLPMYPTPPEHAAKIGAYLIEGTTTIGELLHQDHINKARKLGEDVVGKFVDAVETDTGTEQITFAKAAPSHYGHVQDLVTLNLIPRFSMIPFPNLKWVWWTGHEYAGEDEATGQTRLGPGVVGKAATMKVPRKVGNTFHMVNLESIQTDMRTHKSTRTIEYRAYFESHADAQLTRQMWPAGIKLDEEAVPIWKAKFPDGYIPLVLGQKGIEQYLEFHDELSKQDKLVITPGAVVDNPAQISGEVVQGIAATTAPAPPAQDTRFLPAQANQIKPPMRGYKPLMRSVQTIRPAAITVAGTTLVDQLTKSIEQVTGAPVELPDINAVPAAAEKTEKGE